MAASGAIATSARPTRAARRAAHHPVLRLLHVANGVGDRIEYENVEDRTIADAILRAIRADDMDRAGSLIWPQVNPAGGVAAVAMLDDWFAGLTDEQIGRSVELILASAWLSLMKGDADRTIRCITLAQARAGRNWRESIADSERLGVLALLIAVRASGGVQDMYETSTAAYEALPTDSPWRPQAGALSGIALALSGRHLQAIDRLRGSAELADALGQHSARLDCLAALGCLALDAGDRLQSDTLIMQAMNLMINRELTHLPTSAYAVSVVAWTLARAGRSGVAAPFLERAVKLTADMAGLAPWLQVQARILQADACLLLGDMAGSRKLARAAGDLLHRPDRRQHFTASQRAAVADVEQQLAQLPADMAYGTAPFTQAELRILHLLPTHLTFPEMGALLFVTRHTVKTQALGIYRKLGATSRNEAVERACTLGYLTPMVVPNALTSTRGLQ